MSSTGPVFEQLAERYDAWYDGPAGRVAFPVEAETLAPLLDGTPRPRLEVGVGSGRFAAELNVGVGIDPAHAPLRLARDRGVLAVQGVGERLPFRDGAFGAVLVVVTLCFADDPAALLLEGRRVLRDDGALVIGTVFAESAWGAWYREKGAQGHPFYSRARFVSREETVALLDHVGLRTVAARSALLQPPSDAPTPEPPRDGDLAEAGFSAWKAVPSAR